MIDWQFVATYGPDLILACKNTLLISVASLVLATLVGLIIALMRMSHRPVLSRIAWVFIWIMRGTPILLQLFAIYYALPGLGIRLNAWEAGILALGLNSAAYFAEIFRGAISSLAKGQSEAGLAIGMLPRQVLTRIILPQAMRPALPPYIGQATTLVKNSSLASIISVPELMLTTQNIYSSTYRVTEVMLMSGLLYLIMTTVLQVIQTIMERKFDFYGGR